MPCRRPAAISSRRSGFFRQVGTSEAPLFLIRSKLTYGAVQGHEVGFGAVVGGLERAETRVCGGGLEAGCFMVEAGRAFKGGESA